jgi:hypothetical protein
MKINNPEIEDAKKNQSVQGIFLRWFMMVKILGRVIFCKTGRY